MKEPKPSQEPRGRLIGLDIGERRIGVAVSDHMNVIALPECVIERTSLEEDLRTLCDLARDKQAERFIAGLPLRLNGSRGQEAQRVTDFAQKLAERAGIPVEMADERLSTKEAERLLINGDVKRRRRRKIIDKMAAQIILQTYMDARSAHGGQGSQ